MLEFEAAVGGVLRCWAIDGRGEGDGGGEGEEGEREEEAEVVHDGSLYRGGLADVLSNQVRFVKGEVDVINEQREFSFSFD